MNLQPFAQKKKKGKGKKGFSSGFCTCDRLYYPGTGYWILDTTGLQKFNHSLSCLGRHSRILVESPPFGKVSESLGNIGYRKGTIQADRFISLRFNEPRILHIILEGQQPELGLRPEPFPFSLSISPIIWNLVHCGPVCLTFSRNTSRIKEIKKSETSPVHARCSPSQPISALPVTIGGGH